MLLKDFLFSNSGSPWKSLNRSNAKYMAHQHQRPNEGVSMAVSLAFLNDRFSPKQTGATNHALYHTVQRSQKSISTGENVMAATSMYGDSAFHTVSRFDIVNYFHSYQQRYKVR